MKSSDSSIKPTVFAAHDVLIVLCFFLSGSVGLVYEICWIRKASQVFGTTTYAASTVLAVFFGGLTFGSYLAGKLSRSRYNPLMLYAVIEITLGLIIFCNMPLFSLAGSVLRSFYPVIYTHLITISFIRLFAVATIILLPATCMGATLPLLCHFYRSRSDRIGLPVSLLYALNTLGAASGCLLCGLFLIPQIGILWSMTIGGVINISIGLLVWFIYRNQNSAHADIAGIEPISNSEKTDSTLADQNTILAASIFLCGFAALGHEIVWMRFLSLIIYNTVYTYTITLGVMLAGIVIGSLIIAPLLDSMKHRAVVFGTAQLLIALSVVSTLLQPPQTWIKVLDTQDIGIITVICLIILLVPAILSGISLPLAIRMAMSSADQTGAKVGSMTAYNTLGGIAGSLCSGFVLVPLMGMQNALTVLTGLNCAIGLVALLLLKDSMSVVLRGSLAVAGIGCWLLVPFLTKTHVPADYLGYKKHLIDFKEGLNANLSVVMDNSIRTLEIDRLWQGSDKKSIQIMAAHIPMLLHQNPKCILNIGIGVGQTASRFLFYPIDTLDCVDIERELFPFVRKHFPSEWYKDKRVRYIIEDGGNYLRYTNRKYDIISIEIGQSFRPHLASFYTGDFYAQARAHLSDNGMVCQFLSLACLGYEQFRGAIRTFLSVFPQSVLWYNRDEFLLIGTVSSTINLTSGRIALLDSDSAVHDDCALSYWGGASTMLYNHNAYLAGFLCTTESLHRFVKGAPLYRDDRPVLEYQSAQSQSNPPYIDNIIPFLSSPKQIAAFALNDTAVSEIELLRRYNLGNILATALQRAFDESGDIRILLEAHAYNPRSIKVNFALGIEFSKMQKFNEALSYFNAVLEQHPDHEPTHIHLGYMFMQLEELDKATEHFLQVLRINPRNVQAYNNIGVLYMQQQRYSDALSYLEKAYVYEPMNSGIENNLHFCRQQLQQSDKHRD